MKKAFFRLSIKLRKNKTSKSYAAIQNTMGRRRNRFVETAHIVSQAERLRGGAGQ
jgi:AMMECR1 domain-containing protein